MADNGSELHEDRATVSGILQFNDNCISIEGAGGDNFFARRKIWPGYLHHWEGKRVRARILDEKDYETGRPIVIVWPHDDRPEGTVELFFNERLVKYPASRMGHIAVNVAGRVFNFSHLINENEEITREEYLYRPPLGKFSPSPITGRYDISDPERPCYDKFGRLFMRNIHVLALQGLDTERLASFYRSELDSIRSSGTGQEGCEKYPGFSIFTRNCTTIIRDGFRDSGFTSLRGILPRELFISAAREFLLKHKHLNIHGKLSFLPQLKVPEAPASASVPVLNPVNMAYLKKIPSLYS